MTNAQAVDVDMHGIEALPSGSYRVRLQVRGKAIRGTFPSLAQAVDTRDAALRDIADETMVLVDDGTIAALGAAFLRSLEGHRAAKTVRGRWKTHVLGSSLAGMAAREVRRRDVLSWLDDLKAKETAYDPKIHGKRVAKSLSWQTRKHCLNHLRAFFNWAIEHEHVDANPCIGLTVERADGDEDEGYQESWYLAPDEQAKLLDLVGGAERHIVAFAIGTGLRFGELACLHLVDLHLDEGAPFVEVRFGSFDKKRQRYRPPKGRRGEKKTRRVPLFGVALSAARAWLEALPGYAKANPLALAFPTPRGARRDKAPRAWFRAVEAYGIIPRVGRKPWWHLLRHTCASSLVAGWWGRRWALEDASKLLGHSSVKVTERYAHLAPSVIQGTATAAHAAWLTACHEVATTPEKPEELPQNQRPSKPLVGSSNLPGRSETYRSPWQLAWQAVRAVADGEPTALHQCVAALEAYLSGQRAGAFPAPPLTAAAWADVDAAEAARGVA